MRFCHTCRHFDGLSEWCIQFDRHSISSEVCESGWEGARNVHKIGLRDKPVIDHGPRMHEQSDGPTQGRLW